MRGEENDDTDYRVSADRITPNYSLQLEKSKNCICEVHIGPKNITPVRVVKEFLALNNFYGIEVIPSSATYR